MIKSNTRWILKEADTTRCEELSQQLGLDSLLAKILVLRGIETVTEAKAFLSSTVEELHDPFLLPDMKKSVDRIRTAISSKERILIYGDYDCDGVTSTALLYDCLKDLTGTIDYYIPNRFTEGYGLNKGAIEKAKQMDVSLIITVDTGISAVEQVQFANECGIDVIVTDHHEPPERLPDAYAIINPKLSTSTYPFSLLAGVGVTFKLAQALRGNWKAHWLEWTALGTIADLVPLKGENRIFAKLGIKQLNEKPTVGTRALIEASKLNDKTLTAGHIGFSLAPRINASGRLESASIAVELLLSNQQEEAVSIANHLSECNEERQLLVKNITEEAINQVENDQEGNQYCIVVGHEEWNAGVIGIVASKLVEKYYRPVIVCAFDQETGMAKASARSISGFHLYEALKKCEELLTQYGGHEMAAGMSFMKVHFHKFKEMINLIAKESLLEEDYIPKTSVDAVLTIPHITSERIKALEVLAPFGMGNRAPRFMIEKAHIVDKRYIGRDEEHVKLVLAQEHNRLNAIAFKQKNRMELVSSTSFPSVVGEITINEWNGPAEPQFIIQDIQVDSVQVHDKRNKLFQAIRDWDDQIKPLLLFFSEESRRDYITQLKIKDDQQISPFIVVNHSDNWNRWSNITHVFIMEVPKSEEYLQQIFAFFPRLEHVSLYFSKELDEYKFVLSDREHFKKLYYFLYASQGAQTRVKLEEWANYHRIPLMMLNTMINVFHELHMIDVTNDEVKIVEKPIKTELQQSKQYQEAHKWSKLAFEWLQMSQRDLNAKVYTLLPNVN